MIASIITISAPTISPIRKLTMATGDRNSTSALAAVMRLLEKALRKLDRKITNINNFRLNALNICFELKA